ncbi:hypothetical protein IP84_00725 [beta proteobacterium AAP99]|nr:hypothetical protein IP84_00725 [beta proteobacterium AAP99]
MPAGIEIRRPDGRMLFDTSDIGGLVAALVVAPAGSGTTTATLGQFTGRNVVPTSADAASTAGVAISYPGGVPVVSVPQIAGQQRFVYVQPE